MNFQTLISPPCGPAQWFFERHPAETKFQAAGRAVIAWLAVLMWALCASPAAAEETASQPTPIYTGIYINQISGIDFKANQFNADFWIWFRWKGEGPAPLDTFEIIGGHVTSKSSVIRKKLDDGFEYESARVTATIAKPWDLRMFPFDNHDLAISIEDTEQESDKAVFVADHQNQGVDPDVVVSGWHVAGHDHKLVDHVYNSNYGDTSLATGTKSHYSRYSFIVKLARGGSGRFFKFFFGLFVATLVAWCAAFIRPKDSSPRVSVSVGALFAASAVTVSINSQLPDTGAITLADRMIFISLGMILLSLFGTVSALTLHYMDKEQAHRRLDQTSLTLFPLLYVALLFLGIYL
ncbi:MAG: hypothetical protein QE267_01750 [Akkermansiaceae bacterium]|nr:hypothetical protein [Akkermansiaceae bacterium]